MLFERIESEGLAHYSYVIGEAGEAVVIDPRLDCDVYLDLAERSGHRITHILETHRNEDYLIGSPALAERTGAEVWHADAELEYGYGRPVREGQVWRLGNLTLEAMLTPGHTLGTMSYVLRAAGGPPWMLFCGDTMFAGSFGRTDLMGEENLVRCTELLYDSVFGKILPLGDQVVLCPAHGAGSVCGPGIADRPWTTIGVERGLNPKLKLDSRDRFVESVGLTHERPPYFRRMESLNLEGPRPGAGVPRPLPLKADEFSARAEQAQVLDTRETLAFAAGHVPGALFIAAASVASFAGWFLTYDRPILLVSAGGDLGSVTRTLYRMGFHDVPGFLAGGMSAWHTAGLASRRHGVVTVPEMCGRLDSVAETWVLDVRSDQELRDYGRLPAAQHIHLTQLPQHIDEVPRGRTIHLFCGSGQRSTIAASILQQHGFEDLSVIQGGFKGWTSTACPVRRGEEAAAGARA